MKIIEVEIVRVLSRTIRVEAKGTAEARKQIETYGTVEAWSDYDLISEWEDTKIKSVKAQKTD